MSAGEARQCDPLARGRIADVEAVVGEGGQEQPVAGAVDLEVLALVGIVETEDGPALSGVGSSLDVEGVDGGVAVGADVGAERDKRQRRLVLVVGKEEVGGGGEAAP